LEELKKNPYSRRAVVIHTRPRIWLEYNDRGRGDFMCTNAVQYLIRDGKLHVLVQMRSNDVVFGYKNDRAWAEYMQRYMIRDLNTCQDAVVEAGDIYWHASSLHVYEKHFHLVKE
jgi:thymidylate synthase